MFQIHNKMIVSRRRVKGF